MEEAFLVGITKFKSSGEILESITGIVHINPKHKDYVEQQFINYGWVVDNFDPL